MDQSRLETFCCRMRVTTAVSLLGWVGIVINILALMVSFFVLFVYEEHVIKYIASIPITFIICLIPTIFIILLIMNILLVKRNRAGSFSEVKSILSVEMAVNLGLFISTLTLIDLMALFENLYYTPIPLPVLSAIFVGSIILELVWMIFAYLAREMKDKKEMKNLVKAYIMFNIVLLVLQLVPLILLFTQGEVLVGVILIILVAIVYFLYHIGYIMVLHNIMNLSMDDGNEINSE